MHVFELASLADVIWYLPGHSPRITASMLSGLITYHVFYV
jgi:hypothetical protein